MIAYEITNTVNGKRYIGITRQALAKRWNLHVSRSQTFSVKRSAIAQAIASYGIEAFQISALASARTVDDLRQLECILIAQECTIAPKGYNLTGGGEGLMLPSEAARASMSEGQRRRFASAEARAQIGAKISASMKGRKHSAETRERIRLSLIGKKRSPAAKAAISAALTGKARWNEEQRREIGARFAGKPRVPHTEEAKRRMSETRKGVSTGPRSAETRARISAANKGKKRSSEVVEAMRQRVIAFYQRKREDALEQAGLLLRF